METGSQRKVNQKGMQMYTDCTFVPLRVEYNETRTELWGGVIYREFNRWIDGRNIQNAPRVTQIVVVYTL